MKVNYLRLSILLFFIFSVNGCSSQESVEKKIVEDEDTLFENAAKAEIVKRYEKAAAIYQTILENYPDSEKRDKALFMLGFLKSENLGQKDEALTYFTQLLEKYPNSDLADDAEFMIGAIKEGKDALSTFEEKGL